MAQGAQADRWLDIKEVAHLAGVTVRSLQKYERMELLTPARGQGGTRRYSESDLQALVQIVALKSVGVPLKQIGALRSNGPVEMLRTLGTQRRALERRKPVVDQILHAVRNVEDALGRGAEADPAVLLPLAEARRTAGGATAPDSPEESTTGWAELRARWVALFCDTEAADPLDPRSPEAAALSARWAQLMALTTGGPDYRRDIRSNAHALESAPRREVEGVAALDAIGPALARWSVG
jgi:DNA-binding transcriptional MerR regulator